MRQTRDQYDDEVDREAVLAYVRMNPGKSCQEAEIKHATGVPKSRVRRLMLGVPEIDQEKSWRFYGRILPEIARVYLRIHKYRILAHGKTEH